MIIILRTPEWLTHSSRFPAPTEGLGWLYLSLSHREANTDFTLFSDFTLVPVLRIVQRGEEGTLLPAIPPTSLLLDSGAEGKHLCDAHA